MLTRIYLNNFRCFVNFEYRPGRKQLILGDNGSGKTSLLDALLFVRQFVARGDKTDDVFFLHHRTRWLNQPEVTWEIEAALDVGKYTYRLVIEPLGEPARPRVVSETVHLDGKPIFEFIEGDVHLFNDLFEQTVSFPFDWHRSALSTTMARKDNQKLSRFRAWFTGLLCFRINPYAGVLRAEKEDLAPNVDLSNFPSWYRHLVQAYPRENASLLDSLRDCIDDFRFLQLEPVGENVRLLVAEFAKGSGPSVKFGFNELSDGQRCLVCLYTILHFIVATGNTVILDEPENFLSLREIQPWLMAVAEAVDNGQGQVILISHHPELINQWAPDYGVQFVREGLGPVRVKEFRGEPESSLTPAELIARGWVNG